MTLWRADYDPKARVVRHRVAPGFGHALLAPLVGNVFEALRVSAAVWEHGVEWFTIHAEPNLSAFESEHGIDTERGRYNHKSCLAAIQTTKVVRGQWAGYSDFFVPIVSRGQVAGTLVTGPFATARPSGAQIQERWRWLTGRQGHPEDPEFASYLAASLSTLVLDDGRLAAFERLLGCIGRLMAGEGHAGALASEATVLRAELQEARHAEHVWEAVRTMVDDRSSRTWQSAYHASDLAKLGLSKMAEHVLVALASNATPASDPVDEAVRRYAFQRSSVDLARAVGGVIAGQVGAHGAVFLSSESGPPHKRRRTLLDLMERASTLAGRRFGLSLCFGDSAAPETAPLSRSYQAALGAAESALAKGAKRVTADLTADRPSGSLWHLRRELAHVLEERPALLSARFDGYMEAVALYCGYRMDSARAQLEIGFERTADALLARGALDEKSFVAMREELERASAAARTTTELFAAYRRAVADVSHAVEKPAPARQDRSLRRAVDYIDQHYAEPLRLEKVASVAGFEPTYFSKLFARRERVSFAKYVTGLRLERAKQLLASTELEATRVAEMSGFRSPQYFSGVFRRATGATPLAWRQQPERMFAAGKARKQKQQKH